MGTKNLKYFVNILLLLIIPILTFHCAYGKQQQLLAEQYKREKRVEGSIAAKTYFIKFICPKKAEKYVDNLYLGFPFSVKVYPGEKKNFTIYFPDTGLKYGGEIYAMGEDTGNYGKYPGYELCITDELLMQASSDEKIAFYLQSPNGELMVKITLWKGN